jgi:protein subunit release factor A
MKSKEMPIYIRIEEYKDVLEAINVIKNKLEDAKELLAEINEIKDQEDKELSQWESGLDDVEKKLRVIDKTLFEPQKA